MDMATYTSETGNLWTNPEEVANMPILIFFSKQEIQKILS
jgi:hypothetical protein